MMNCYRGFRVVYLSLLLASLTACGAAAEARADEGTPPVKEQPPAQSQGTTTITAEVQSAPTVTMLTLSQCIDVALRKNPTILAALYNVDVFKNRVGEARSSYYPQVNAQGSYDRLRAAGTNINFAQGSTTYNEYVGSISLNQTILDFGHTSSSVDVSKYNLDSSRSSLTAAQDLLILSVKQAYYGVLQAQRNLAVAVDVIKQYQLHLEQAQGFYEVGTNAKIDVIKAEVDLSNARLSLINADNTLKIAKTTLNNALGLVNAPDFAIEDNLSFQKYAITLDDAITRAYENRPDLKAAVAQSRSAEENITLQRTGYYPVLSGRANYFKTEIDMAPYTTGTSWDIGVVLTIPLFSGFLTEHQVAEAKSNYYLTKANEDSLRLQIVLDVRQAYLNLQAADASISTSELAAKQAKENLDLANGRYAAGVGSPIEVSDAFATYVSSQAAYNGALYNYKVAEASIEKAMGAR